MWLTDLKNSKTELPDLSNYVQMDEKTTKNEKILKVTHSLEDIMKIVFIDVYANNSSTVVYGGDILSFHFFEALNDNFEA